MICPVFFSTGALSLLCIQTVVFAFVLSTSAFDTSSWQRFWWWSPGQTWPSSETDVLKNAYGTCKLGDLYCFQRLPSWAEEDSTELLAIDSEGTVYQWKFDSKNPTAHAVWQALHDHLETPVGKIVNNKAWDPLVTEGTKPKATQDSFMYRDQNGVKSFLLDDDNCDCLSTLSMGHGMCLASHSTTYSAANVFGVDKLYDPGCHGPSPSNGLSLYFRTIKKLTMEDFGGGWRAFWWWEKDSTWPGHVTDILGSPYGSCKEFDVYCFQRLPSWLKENDTELLAVDSLGTVYKWAFNPQNSVSHATWLAFHDHQESQNKDVLNSSPWNPVALNGTAPSKNQDSFMYREQNGVKSLLLDDDNCDCYSSLNLGHGMCNNGHSTSFSKANVFGVDAIFDNGCHGPVPNISLTLYYRARRPDVHDFGGKWRAFWWWNAGVEWSACESEKSDDVLEHPYGTCSGGDPFCFQRLPAWLEEDSTVILAKDSQENVYQWQFNDSNPTASAAWNAFHSHTETAAGAVLNQIPWNPKVLQGKSSAVDQDSFTYRSANKVKSVLLDDDNCDCLSTLQLGATVCSNQLDPNGRGVDVLYDPVCNLPSPQNGLVIYFKLPKQPFTFEGYGHKWTAFWWWPKDGQWPGDVTDVLEKPHGTCKETDIYCFGRLPSGAKEDKTKLLAIDTDGNVYMWKFSSGNPTAHAVWQALHDHNETLVNTVKNNKAWNPKVLKGTKPKADQDSFMYRPQAGVKSLLLDDDNCDCLSTLSFGHGMCSAGFSTSHGPANRYGVDALYDDYCNTPRPSVGLTLYYSMSEEVVHHPTLCTHDGNWLAFWWWTAGATWPANEKDVLAYPYGHCSSYSEYCFGRIPFWAREDSTEMLAIDSEGNEYLWKFDPDNAVAHAAWLAFHDHQVTLAGKVVNSQDSWDPVVLKGTKPKAKQDSFMYRVQNGVKSILMDDDNCDCLTTLNIGHGMCAAGHSTSYGPANQFGVDALYDSYCNVPRPEVGLTLYFRAN